MRENSTEVTSVITFVGGGNMAQAILGGLLKNSIVDRKRVLVIEPDPAQRRRLETQFGLFFCIAPDEIRPLQFSDSDVFIWAVKPQAFKEAAEHSPWKTFESLHLSVAAGVTVSSISRWLGSDRIVRAMPNTPALIGQGMTGLYAGAAVGVEDRTLIDNIMGVTGWLRWFDDEAQLDAVTALSGSGPAYVFYFLEAMVQAGQEMGLSESAARTLATQTFSGGAALAAAQPDVTLATLRERVTSKGGTTYAALTSMEESGVKDAFVKALHAAKNRATELGREFV